MNRDQHGQDYDITSPNSSLLALLVGCTRLSDLKMKGDGRERKARRVTIDIEQWQHMYSLSYDTILLEPYHKVLARGYIRLGYQ